MNDICGCLSKFTACLCRRMCDTVAITAILLIYRRSILKSKASHSTECQKQKKEFNSTFFWQIPLFGFRVTGEVWRSAIFINQILGCWVWDGLRVSGFDCLSEDAFIRLRCSAAVRSQGHIQPSLSVSFRQPSLYNMNFQWGNRTKRITLERRALLWKVGECVHLLGGTFFFSSMYDCTRLSITCWFVRHWLLFWEVQSRFPWLHYQ